MYKLFVNVGPQWLPTRGTRHKNDVLEWADKARKTVEAAPRGLILVTEDDEPLQCWVWARKRWTQHKPER